MATRAGHPPAFSAQRMSAITGGFLASSPFTLPNRVYVKWDVVQVTGAGLSLCASHCAGVQGCSQSVAGQPSAAAIRAYIVAPSIDSRIMSA
jgi:hypothetical protein